MKNYTIESISVDDLHFDFKNPRLAEFNLSSKTEDGEILKVLWETMSVNEIVLSIAASGFFQHEPLIAVKEKINGALQLTVIEGNRRLAAVKTILRPDIFENLDIFNPKIKVSAEIKKELTKLPVITVPNREEAWKFIGFKHINGPAKWGSFAKAQYISQIHKDFNVSLDQIALQIGDTNKTVEKLYQGLRVLELAEEFKVFDRTNISGNRLFFSHLYTGLGYEGIKNYIGFSEAEKDLERPLKKEKKEEVRNLMTWMFGNKHQEIEPVIRSQNPDLKRLDSVLKKSESVTALKNGTELAVAYEMSQPNKEVFEDSLVNAKQNLQKAHAYWSIGYDNSTQGLQTAGDIADLAENLYVAMTARYHDQKKKAGTAKKRSVE